VLTGKDERAQLRQAKVTWLAGHSLVWVIPGQDAEADRDELLYRVIATAYPDLSAECAKQLAGDRERPFSEPWPTRDDWEADGW
jgi:hypothetical protein